MVVAVAVAIVYAIAIISSARKEFGSDWRTSWFKLKGWRVEAIAGQDSVRSVTYWVTQNALIWWGREEKMGAFFVGIMTWVISMVNRQTLLRQPRDSMTGVTATR